MEENVRRRPLYKYVKSYADQAGTARHYFRRRGYPAVPLPSPIGSPEFVLAYAAAMGAETAADVPAVRRPPERGPLVGVYLLMLKGKIVYIGSSLKMPKRVMQHRSNGRPFDKAFYIATEPCERDALERLLIRALDPPQNKTFRVRADNDNCQTRTEGLQNREIA